jgi:hypothetical protein
MTQILARFTGLLDGRRKVKMTGRLYLRAIVPIGVFFSLSLICGNVTYLYLSVPFIQMLKVRYPFTHPRRPVGMNTDGADHRPLPPSSSSCFRGYSTSSPLT